MHPPKTPTPTSPSEGLLAALRTEMVRHPPFAQMEPSDVDVFIARSEQRYFAPGEILVAPAAGVVSEIFFIRRGAVSGVKGHAELAGAFKYEAGELFPVSAAMARRPVTATYTAVDDTFVLALPRLAMQELADRSPPFADFLARRVAAFVDQSRRALQAAYASQTLAEQSLETPLGELARQPVATCAPDAPLEEVLARMHEQRIGSMLVADPQGRPLGILTRSDVLGRVALARVALERPVSEVMVSPVHVLTVQHTAQDAALLMSAQGIRHVPVTKDGVVAGIVSERDLFAMQRLSLKQVGAAVRSAPDIETLQGVAHDIRGFARNLLGQGVQARQLTALVSHLNDVLTQRLLELLAPAHGVRLEAVCWLALGSEGRSEQTIATDQDNALILPDGCDAAGRAAALAFGRAANEALAACGFPLCRGNIMAGNPELCLTLREWRERFSHWIEHGAPEDLLNASIFFDFRALAGDAALAQALRTEVVEAARRTPRFLKQLALNAVAHGPPLNWIGGIDEDEDGFIDLKLQGTAIFVDAARVYSLAHGVAETGTRDRLEHAGRRMGLKPAEYDAWAGAFEFLQMLRLRVQLDESGHPNRQRVDALNDIDRRILRESFRLARLLQQRLRLDYDR